MDIISGRITGTRTGGDRMTHQGARGDDALTALTRDWLGGITQAGFVPGVRARARVALQDLLDELIAAVRAEPFDPAVGRRVGADLVDLRMSAPQVIGTTVRLLAE